MDDYNKLKSQKDAILDRQKDFNERINAVAVEGAFKVLMAAKWTPSTFAEAYKLYHAAPKAPSSAEAPDA